MKKILIIDDEEDLCILMKNYLVNRNYKVYYAHTLKEGMDMMDEIMADIVFLDNNLPDGTGWSEAGFFLDSNPSLELYLMSGYQPQLPDGYADRVNVIPKPISFSDLENVAAGSR